MRGKRSHVKTPDIFLRASALHLMSHLILPGSSFFSEIQSTVPICSMLKGLKGYSHTHKVIVPDRRGSRAFR